MKAVALFLTVVCLAHATQVPLRTANKQYLNKQKSIYELFWHVDQPTVYHPELYQKAKSFSIEDNISSYKDQVTYFIKIAIDNFIENSSVMKLIISNLITRYILTQLKKNKSRRTLRRWMKIFS